MSDLTDIIRKIKESEPEGLFRQMYGSNMIVGCCTAQSRELIDKYGMFDERYRIIEDYPRYLRLSREGVRIHFFDRVVVKYRMGGVSSQARFNEVYEKGAKVWIGLDHEIDALRQAWLLKKFTER